MKKHLLLLALQLASGVADFHYTNRNAHTPNFIEHDPIARPFVTHSTAERAAYFAVTVGGAIATAELLDHFGHAKPALALRAAQIADNGLCATYSATH